MNGKLLAWVFLVLNAICIVQGLTHPESFRGNLVLNTIALMLMLRIVCDD